MLAFHGEGSTWRMKAWCNFVLMTVPTGNSLARELKKAVSVFIVLVFQVTHVLVFVIAQSCINVIRGVVEITASWDSHGCLVGDTTVVVVVLFQ